MCIFFIRIIVCKRYFLFFIIVQSHKFHSLFLESQRLLSKNINFCHIEIYQNCGFKVFNTFTITVFVLEKPLYLTFTFIYFFQEELYL